MTLDHHGALDLRLFDLLNSDGGPWLDAVMRLLSARAFGLAAGGLLCALLLARLRARSWPALLALALALLVSDLAGSQLLRPWLGGVRPCYALPPGTFRQLAAAANGPSLPSLHASNAFALALVATLAWRRLWPFVYLLAAGHRPLARVRGRALAHRRPGRRRLGHAGRHGRLGRQRVGAGVGGRPGP